MLVKRSLMLSDLQDKIVNAYLKNDVNTISKYEEMIEVPYFDNFIKNVGWHRA